MMNEREKYTRQIVAEWLREQSDSIITGCNEIDENPGDTLHDLPSIPGNVSYQEFCDTVNIIATENENL